MKKVVKRWVESCEECQKRSSRMPKELGNASGEPTLFGRVSLDVVHMKASPWKYLVVARDDLSGWVETQSLRKLSALKVQEFFMNNWVYRYGAIKIITVDGGSEFQGEVASAARGVGAKLVKTTPYWPQAAGQVERGHQPIKDALVKMCGGNGKKWQDHLQLVTWADRILTWRSTGYSPYEVLFFQAPVLPIDIEE